MPHDLMAVLNQGLPVNGGTLYAYAVTPGRFREESNIEMHYRQGSQDYYLLYAKVFKGRPPDYGPWVELYSINRTLAIGGRKVEYFDSIYEARVLETFSMEPGPGARLFVEYYNDHETRNQLQSGLPVVLSRLGAKMFKLGYTWFKDWYFPEGFLEGTQKLQGERPHDAAARSRHLAAISNDLSEFLRRSREWPGRDDYIRRGLARCGDVALLLDRAEGRDPRPPSSPFATRE